MLELAVFIRVCNRDAFMAFSHGVLDTPQNWSQFSNNKGCEHDFVLTCTELTETELFPDWSGERKYRNNSVFKFY